jgi:glycogen debranching enzyme
LPEDQPASSSLGVAPHYISAVSVTTGRDPLVLKTGDAFAIFDNLGDIQGRGLAAQGVVFEDTRYLSKLVLAIDDAPPLLLSSTVSAENAVFEADLTNTDLYDGGTLRLPRDSVHIRKTVLLGPDVLFVTLELTNFAASRCDFRLDLSYAADFVDLFELRGSTRARHGDMLPPQLQQAGLVLGYRGLDKVERRTEFTFTPAPQTVAADRAGWKIDLAPGEELTIQIEARFVPGERRTPTPSLAQTLSAVKKRLAVREAEAARIETGNDGFDDWLTRSRADLAMLITDTPDGPYPYAGIPWFSTAFGRDGLITALECLWLDPAVAAGTLRFLAARQATSVDPKADAQPGKILHETRKGEMAALGEIPYGCYYGSVDSTPLFVMLADAYHARTGDLDLIHKIWPNIEKAVDWIGAYGDADHDGFVEYGHQAKNGLVNQGWKDTGDAIFHRDGQLAKGPIALVEVQAYVHAAYRGAARLAGLMGDPPRAAEYAGAADRLREKFDAAFWCEELGTYALALDGDKRQCQIRTSNPGHVLLGGLASEPRAQQVAQSLMSPDFFSGWGIRTLAAGESRFNPMSYHNGSVWPHDNAVIAMGFAKYGLKEPLVQAMTGLFGASMSMPLHRLPELFCGFARRSGYGPVAYPVACNPQAWASASVFAMLGAALGISFDAAARRVHFRNAILPAWLPTVRVANLRLGDASVDLLLERHDDALTVHVVGRHGQIEVVQTG